jgi:hypothetical protein
MTAGQPLGFAIVGVETGDAHRTVARFRCVECPTSIDLTVKSGQPLNPQALVDRAKQRGWEAHATRSNRCFCPRCAGPRRARLNDTGSELRRIEARMPTKPPAAMPAVSAIRSPPAEQRSAIRRLMEQHFDEGEGCYLADWSDARIAMETGAPQISVERLRDAAFGPIRISPETIALRRDVADIRRTIDSLKSGADALADQLRADAAALAERLAAIEQRIVAPAAAA